MVIRRCVFCNVQWVLRVGRESSCLSWLLHTICYQNSDDGEIQQNTAPTFYLVVSHWLAFQARVSWLVRGGGVFWRKIAAIHCNVWGSGVSKTSDPNNSMIDLCYSLAMQYIWRDLTHQRRYYWHHVQRLLQYCCYNNPQSKQKIKSCSLAHSHKT